MWVTVTIEYTDSQIKMDTGADASILSYADYERHFKYLTLRPENSLFHAYAGTPLGIAGQILVDVEHNSQRATLPLLFVCAEQYAPPLLGRSWMLKVSIHLQLVSSRWKKTKT